jgi:glucan biosynthesis protein
LINPPRTAVSVFKADDVVGFGLMQRDRDYDIVAFWIPERRAEVGQDWTFAYRLHFLLDHALDRGSGLTTSTHSGRSETGEPVDINRWLGDPDWAMPGIVLMDMRLSHGRVPCGIVK